MSTNDTVTQNGGSFPAKDETRQQFNNINKDFNYGRFNRPAWQVAAAAVAPPVCATGTTTSKAKTTATTQLVVGGVLKSLTATDDLWSFVADAANTLAIGSVRRYQLCWDGTSATTVVSVRPSNDQVIATSPLGTAASALAACRWFSLPPNGTVIVGVLSLTNGPTAPVVFTPGTTLFGATGVVVAFIDGDDQNCFLSSQVAP